MNKARGSIVLMLIGAAVFFGGGYLSQGVSSSNFTPELAGITFIAITIEIGIVLLVVARTWKKIVVISSKLPPNRPKLKLGPKGYKESVLTYKSSIPYYLSLGMIFLCGSLFFNLISLLGIGGAMLVLRNGLFTMDNYEWAIVFAEFGVVLFVIGMLVVSGLYLIEGMRYLGGKGGIMFGISRGPEKQTKI
ncbi:MAG: hypothetical protein ACLFPU_09290 [Dehalococcoidia bacterium]